MKNYQTCK